MAQKIAIFTIKLAYLREIASARNSFMVIKWKGYNNDIFAINEHTHAHYIRFNCYV